METKIYNQKGAEAGVIKLSDKAFGLPWNADLVHQVAMAMMSNARTPVADTKGRGEVRGGGKKPWRQKGTGRARHGSTRSPIWKGGGVTHGPLSEKNFKKKINKKMKSKALLAVLSEKFRNNEILFVDEIVLKDNKTALAAGVLKALGKVKGFEKLSNSKKQVALFAMPENNESLKRSFRNIPAVAMDEARNLSPLELLNNRYLIVLNPEASLKFIESKVKA
jgi:large subunit ribosomal protein L4